ncbi:helix-turn-helix transcriptional regulator [Lacticaseibacillus mingshuiensis]|uniref:Helix-turn-helix domain-containing protein n=1 Tax=Lacticaseibacillus mingshuiensis TaxID=2799574 RepID=A0ABW4CH67_9LACO|nr:helix-turn-helix domain-containing protein [Lacticaseibacillus mingshuiensis]
MTVRIESTGMQLDYPLTVSEGKDASIAPHWHTDIEILYIREGAVELGLPARRYRLASGSFFIIPSALPHSLVNKHHAKWLQYRLHPAMLAALETGNGAYALAETLRHRRWFSEEWPTLAAQRVRQLLLQINAEHLAENRRFVQLIAVAGIFDCLTRDVPASADPLHLTLPLTDGDALTTLLKVANFVEANYSHPFTLAEVAAAVGFSPHYFATFFRKTTGLTFMTYLTRYRLGVAKYLLRSATMPISLVAFRAGFGSLKTFYRVFKAETGTSPLKFREVGAE